MFGFGTGLKLAGGYLQHRSDNKKSDAAWKGYEKLQEGNARFLEDAQNLSRQLLENRPVLDINRDYTDSAVKQAQYDSANAGGRISGEENMRDAVRQTSADSFGRVKRSSASSADLIAGLSGIDQSERNSMRDVDRMVQQQRQAQKEQAKNRLYGALNKRAAFNFDADMREFDHNEAGRYEDEKSQKFDLIQLEKDFFNENLSQYLAAKDANSAVTGNLGAGLSGLGQGMDEMSAEVLKSLIPVA